MIRNSIKHFAILYFAVLTGACAPRHRPPTISPLLTINEDLSRLGDDFILRQKITAQFQGRELSFMAVLQKQAKRLTILGLTPMGTRAFLLEKEGTELKFKNFTNRKLPFSPEFMVLDIQCIFEISEARADGVHERKEDNARITEEWMGNKLTKRDILVSHEGQEQQISITYKGGYRRNEPATQVTLTNKSFGYTLVIENQDYRRITGTTPS